MSGARRQPNFETMRNDEAEGTERDAADKENERPENEHECPESKNMMQESAHDRNAPDGQDDDSGCICRARDMP
jgi:hypothetical protein